MSQNTKTILTLIGFALSGVSFFTLALNFIGIDFEFMHWMKSFGAMTAFIMKVLLLMVGFIFIYFGLVDLEQEEA